MDFHKRVSYIKSTLHILSYILLPFRIVMAGGLLIIAEILGYVEEWED